MNLTTHPNLTALRVGPAEWTQPPAQWRSREPRRPDVLDLALLPLALTVGVIEATLRVIGVSR